MQPPIKPMMTASPPLGALGPAVIATKPAIAPLITMVTSLFPVRARLNINAPMTPPAAAMFVLRNTWLTAIALASLLMTSSEPPLNPNQPSHRINTPKAASGILEPGIGLTDPFAPYFPFLGPSNVTTPKAAAAPNKCTVPEPA